MSLQDIKLELAEVEGFDEDVSSENSRLLRFINRAARELYEEHYLYLAEREQVIVPEVDQQQITLPYYVEKLVAIRRYLGRQKIDIQDMRPRYRSRSWKEPYLGNPFLNIRFKQRQAYHTSWENFGPMTVSIPVVEATDIIVTIVGSTLNAVKVREQVTISAGNLSATFTKSFTDIDSLMKDRVTDNNVTLKDLDGNEVSELPNHLKTVSYPLFQVLDRYEELGSSNNLMEILYKLPFAPFVNNEDRFLDDKYDNAIYHKTREYLYEQQDDKDNQRIRAAQKAVASLEKVNKQYIPDAESNIKFTKPIGTAAIQQLKAGILGG